ncbi:MAG: glycosyltransferase family 2 protein [Candidatus Bathyarchaeota archaeon]|nr:glycosyltransferase family 2 protein [Candidatus Bathyarchaeota archaeon]
MDFLKMKLEKNHQTTKVTVVFPAYNEADVLEDNIRQVIQNLENFTDSYEIIIAEDGSTDGTNKLAAMLAKKNSHIKHVHRQKRLGRGTALKNSFKKSIGETLVYMDLDLATDLKHLEELIAAINEEGFDLATGSRLLSGSKVNRSWTRNLASSSYNLIVRKLLGSNIMDHQCGFKSFKREPLLLLLDEVEATHWFWDTEILVRANLRGYKIKEIPVLWRSGKETKVRLVKDSLNMFWQALSLWWRLKRNN